MDKKIILLMVLIMAATFYLQRKTAEPIVKDMDPIATRVIVNVNSPVETSMDERPIVEPITPPAAEEAPKQAGSTGKFEILLQ